ncbi:hypothetical protein CREGCYN_01670 [Synechococcus sp. M16CYN]
MEKPQIIYGFVNNILGRNCGNYLLFWQKIKAFSNKNYNYTNVNYLYQDKFN